MFTENIAIAIPPNTAARISKSKWMRRMKKSPSILLGSIELVFVSFAVFDCSALIEGEIDGTNKCGL